MMTEIHNAMKRAGLAAIPEDPETPLSAYGLDSLTTVLLIDALEKQFGIRITADEFDPRHFVNLNALETFLHSRGIH